MQKFIIAIEELFVQKFEIEAINAEEAMKIAERKYNDGEFVLAKSQAQFKQMSVINPEDEITEWSEF